MMIADLVKRLITFVKIKNNHLKCGGDCLKTHSSQNVS